MTDREIVNLFEQHHPKSVEDVQALGLAIEFVSSGGSRKVYRLGKRLAVKFCHCENIYQSQNEIACIERMQTDPSLEKFRPHIPALFYGNKETGVIVTRYYPGKVEYSDTAKFQKLMDSLQAVGIQDLFSDNFRQDSDGTFIAVDLGHYRKLED
jgi:hypothetical protein